MKLVIGLLVSIGCIFGSYVFMGGKISVLLHVLPAEMVAILGGGIGAVLIDFNRTQLMDTLKSIFKVAGSTAGQIKRVEELLDGLEDIIPEYKKDPFKFENMMEENQFEENFGFNKYNENNDLKPFVIKVIEQSNQKSNSAKPNDFQKDFIKGLGRRLMVPSDVLKSLAEILPALGIVVAVLGIVKAMGALNQATDVLGQLISAALVGTMLGIFLSYCVFGPLSKAARLWAELELLKYRVIERVFDAASKGATVDDCIDHGRAIIPLNLK